MVQLAASGSKASLLTPEVDRFFASLRLAGGESVEPLRTLEAPEEGSAPQALGVSLPDGEGCALLGDARNGSMNCGGHPGSPRLVWKSFTFRALKTKEVEVATMKQVQAFGEALGVTMRPRRLSCRVDGEKAWCAGAIADRSLAPAGVPGVPVYVEGTIVGRENPSTVTCTYDAASPNAVMGLPSLCAKLIQLDAPPAEP